jgi:hypothetical protein
MKVSNLQVNLTPKTTLNKLHCTQIIGRILGNITNETRWGQVSRVVIHIQRRVKENV